MTRADEAVGPVIGQIQTDTFCEGCGYNLHAQAVMRDERLGILVSRCPECGRFAPAGHSTTAARLWLSRVLTLCLGVWVLVVLGLFALCTLFMGMTAYGHLQNDVRWRQVARPLSGSPSYEYYVFTPAPGDAAALQNQQFERWAMAMLAAGLGLFAGMLFSVLLWHLRWPWRALAWVPPLVGCGVAALGWANDPAAVHLQAWGLRWIAAYWAIECVGVGVGLLLGRPVVRGLLRVLVPPRPRQHLAFLWLVDGRQPPAPRDRYEPRTGRLTPSAGETRNPG